MSVATVEGSLASFEADETLAGSISIERSRFLSILRRYIHARGSERTKLRDVVKAYLTFSPNSDMLINEMISACVDMKITGRLDAAIDVLGQLGNQICRFANEFLIADIKNWDLLYPERAYKPNDDYWYILLRSVAQSNVTASDRLRFVRMCGMATSRSIVEAVLESLGDIASEDAFNELRKYIRHSDPFIAKLAANILENR